MEKTVTVTMTVSEAEAILHPTPENEPESYVEAQQRRNAWRKIARELSKAKRE